MPGLKNLDAGILRAMTAYLKERGLTDAEAAKRASAKLPQARAFVQQKLAEDSNAEFDVQTAFGQLKTWTRTNV